MKKVLVAFYSYSGTTKDVAKDINRAIGGELFEIKTANAYPQDYNDVVKQAKQELSAGFKPELEYKVANIDDYDLVILGSPNWWSTIAPPVMTFLAGADFSKKTIAPFITHGGGGLNRTVRDIKKLCPDANVLEGFDANHRGQLSKWLNSLNIKENM